MNPARLFDSRMVHVPSADWGGAQIRVALGASPGEAAVRRLESVATAALGIDCMAAGSGRSAIWAALVTMPSLRRVWVPAYTCVAVPNAVAGAGLEAVWVDVVGPNVDLDRVIREAQPGDAVIVQHTYGVPVDPRHVQRARGAGLYVIEDRAHRFDGRDVAGDAAVFSLEHSKVVSGGQGGLLHVADGAQRERARDRLASLDAPDQSHVRRVMLTSLSQRILDIHAPTLGRAASGVRRLLLRLGAFSVPGQTDAEMSGEGEVPRRISPRLAAVAAIGIDGLTANLEHRALIGGTYRTFLRDMTPEWVPDGAPLLRYPIVVDEPDAVSRACRGVGIDLGVRWFEAPVHPRGAQSSYRPGTAPRAEALAASVMSLPTHPRVRRDEAMRIAQTVRAAVAAAAG